VAVEMGLEASGIWLLTDEDLRLVKDLVLSTGIAWAVSTTAVSFASSNVSYRVDHHQQSPWSYLTVSKEVVRLEEHCK
jgi:hypothetical protein